jgi:hypothetical protein
MVKIGNAPVSYGAFAMTVGKHEGVPTAAEAPELGMAELARTCDEFDVVPDGTGRQFLPRPTVALIGSARRFLRDRGW